MLLPKDGLFGIKFGLASTFFTMFVIDCVEGAFLPKILEVRGFSSANIGELRAIGYGTVIAAPFLYALLAQFMNNRRLALQVGSWISGITVIALFGKWGFLGFGALMVVQNFFQQGTASQMDALSMNTLKDKNVYGRIRLFGSLGYVVSVITGGFVADHFGFLNIIWYMIIVQCIMMVTLFFLPSDRLSQDEVDALKENKAHETKEEHKAGRFPIKLAFVLLMAFEILKMMSQGVYQNFMMIYMTDDLGISNAVGGTIMSLGIVAEMVGLVIAVYFIRNLKVGTILFIVGVACALRWFMQGFGHYVAIIVIAQSLHMFTFAIGHVTILKCINEIFPQKKHVAIAIGIYGSAGLGLGRILGSLTAGFTWDLGIHTAFTVSIFIALAAGVVGLFVKSKGDADIDKRRKERKEKKLQQAQA